MDDIDSKIVALLRENARRSFQDIGQPRPPVRSGGQAPRRPARARRRDPRLHGDRRPARRSAGTPRRSSTCTARGGCPREAIKRAVEREPGVVAAHTVAGEASALLHVMAQDTKDLEQVLERIRAADGITRTVTEVVLSTLFQR